ncbi:MAG TPA: sigma 54-interacting transcriptional regulator [Verrucomicrobiota bacterium]|nr:sigma 54-interacting transcriptional regulator [Verrucomicrobiota bacterium]HRZ38985.1 sigma 54-interacting transcriptional regulator [Candidatus Paceibacterota bacterium]HRZ56722.1 sigma 54-interacting transcriptional regulator [Candidatus Paceibacterota bacterium]
MPDPVQSQLLDSVPDGVFTVDTEWRITTFNRSAERITGIHREEALGRRCCDVFRASICESACAVKQTLATGRPVVNKVVYIIDASGQRLPISVSTAVLRDSRGRAIGGVESFRDLRVVEELQRQARAQDSCSDLIGRSTRMRELFELLPVVAASESTVLIEGASGTGKELVARAIHAHSRRSTHPFLAVNCAALPDTLLESELFGYKAGAFTDAKKDKPGRFALAQGGTILLDEIGDISAALQARLLRVLQERVYEPLGSVAAVKADVRVIAATNKDLRQLAQEGRFREDLFYRIHVVRLELPCLRDRREDIPLLAEQFIARFNRLQGRDIAGVSEGVIARLMEHDFPGNVRELENAIEHAFVLCRGALIEECHLPPHLRAAESEQGTRLPRGLTLAAMEELLLRDALRRHGGNRAAAARELGINTSTLFRKIKALKLDRIGKGDRTP